MSARRDITELFGEALRYEQGRSPLTVEAYLRDLRQFATFITGGKEELFEPGSVSTNDVRSWLATLASNGRQMSSIKRKLQSVRAFYHFMMRTHRATGDPTAPIEMSLRRRELPRYVPAREMERVLSADACAPDADTYESVRDRMIMMLLYTTGMRRAEILHLHDKDFRLNKGDVLVHGKGDKDRVLPLAQEMIGLIRRYMTMRDQKYPATGVETQHFLRGTDGSAMSEHMITAIVKRELAGTSADKRSPHVIRHTFATSMLNGGADINTVKNFLGHASLATTQIYTHVTFSDMRKAYNGCHPRARTGQNGNKDEK